MSTCPIRNPNTSNPLPRCPDQPRCRSLSPGKRVRFSRWSREERRNIMVHGVIGVHDKGYVTVRTADGRVETASCGCVVLVS